MKKSIITQEQIYRIVSIGMADKKNLDALVAYGGEMFRSGIIKGAVVVLIGTVAGTVILDSALCIYKAIDTKRKSKKQ